MVDKTRRGLLGLLGATALVAWTHNDTELYGSGVVPSDGYGNGTYGMESYA